MLNIKTVLRIYGYKVALVYDDLHGHPNLLVFNLDASAIPDNPLKSPSYKKIF